MALVIAIIIFFLGTIIGSFLNVVIYRHNSGKTLGGRSFCMSCAKTLVWYELVPLASYLAQGGKCTKCASRISHQYPIIEAATGAMFTLIAFKFSYLLPGSVTLFLILVALYSFIFSILIVISAYDIKHTIIPDKFVFLFWFCALVALFFVSGDTLIIHLPSILELLAGFIIALPFALLWLFSRGRLMGLGDPKFMVGMGLLLGLSGGIAAVFIAFWIGAIIGIFPLVLPHFKLKKKTVSMKSQIPFGPFLALATFIVFLFDIKITTILDWFAK